ncbi:MAG: RsmD family RNA methyltransferase, partial [Clostridia bacterium]|nr:RsmD family RNA methyltransferase [Clostridia bacterium]
MRIITGSARGTKLLTLDGLNTRPTAERAKEAIFSKLQFDLEGRSVLDLFAGSGQMGLEALSRGASHAVFCDKARESVEIITKNAEKTRLKEKCTILCTDHADCVRRMAMMNKQFDIVFLDP